eukprot:TRINITY_DN75663_c0_g1_i1.p1 TRINITY_DN75663_c0_g1~~TRINITY_DN75663_c0_g1_i1.p1  ORF type:complete len:598 (+),score=61.11 TRINITY_DN75663_c0_g1_i1:74-1867(+)
MGGENRHRAADVRMVTFPQTLVEGASAGSSALSCGALAAAFGGGIPWPPPLPLIDSPLLVAGRGGVNRTVVNLPSYLLQGAWYITHRAFADITNQRNWNFQVAYRPPLTIYIWAPKEEIEASGLSRALRGDNGWVRRLVSDFRLSDGAELELWVKHHVGGSLMTVRNLSGLSLLGVAGTCREAGLRRALDWITKGDASDSLLGMRRQPYGHSQRFWAARWRDGKGAVDVDRSFSTTRVRRRWRSERRLLNRDYSVGRDGNTKASVDNTNSTADLATIVSPPVASTTRLRNGSVGNGLVIPALERWWHEGAKGRGTAACRERMPVGFLPKVRGFQCRLRFFGDARDSVYPFCVSEALSGGPCLAYSFGVNNQIAFEASLASALPHCEVWAFDNHSVSTSYMLDGADSHDGKKRPKLLPRNLHYRPLMLWGESLGPIEVPLGIQWGFHGRKELWNFQDIRSIVTALGHQRHVATAGMQLVKLDIEGAEYVAAEQVLDQLRPEQLVLEVHNVIFTPEDDWAVRFVRQSDWIRLLAAFEVRGYRLAHATNEQVFPPRKPYCEYGIEHYYGEYLFVHPGRLGRSARLRGFKARAQVVADTVG